MTDYFDEQMLIEQPDETTEQLIARYEQQVRSWRWRSDHESDAGNEAAAMFAGDLGAMIDQLVTALAAEHRKNTTPTREQIETVICGAFDLDAHDVEECQSAADAVLALFSQPSPSAPSETDVLASDEEMAELGEAERHQVPTDEDVANAFRAEGWDRAYDDLVYVQFPNRNPFRTPSPSTPNVEADRLRAELDEAEQRENEMSSHLHPSWDGDEAQIAILMRFVEHAANLDSVIEEAREADGWEGRDLTFVWHDDERRLEWVPQMPQSAEPVRINNLELGASFVCNTDRWDVARRWVVQEDDQGARYLVDDDGRKWPPSMFDPSTFRGVTPPPALPEDGR